MTGGREARRYVHAAYVESLVSRLSARDFEILESLHHCRVLSGNQLERLHFYTLSSHTRARTRRLVLARLTSWGVIAPLERRIGGINGGSSGLIFSLDTAGQRLLQARFADTNNAARRNRRPWTPGQMFVQHSLSVAELYVSLMELSRSCSFALVHFQAEPASWWPDGAGGWLKPDAYLLLETATTRMHFWAEIDRSTESLNTLRRKFMTYLDFLRRGQLGPHEVMPLVVVSVLDVRRRAAVSQVIANLPAPAEQLFVVATAVEAASTLAKLVTGEQQIELRRE
jgi:hypothetical protein